MSSCRGTLYLDDLLVLDSNASDLLGQDIIYDLDILRTDSPVATDLSHASLAAGSVADTFFPCAGDQDRQAAAIYKPRRVRGVWRLREGYCEACCVWLRLKTSSYWYHMNYKHGINSKGIRYPEPQVRYAEHGAEGFCAVCNQWVSLGSKTAGRPTRFGWFKHCQKKHGTGK